MEWDIIYIKDQNCQKRALIIESLTVSKEQLFTLPSLLSAQTESHLVPVNTIISFIFKKKEKNKNIGGCLEWEHARHKGQRIYCLHTGLECIPVSFVRQMWATCTHTHWPVLRGWSWCHQKQKQTNRFSEREVPLSSCTSRLNISSSLVGKVSFEMQSSRNATEKQHG